MTPTLGGGVAIDVPRLIETRMLVQANSGAGKSWALRRLLEQTYGRCQQIVIDVDGEFHTLREKFDYVLAGQKGGDCPADLKSAALLARRLLELNVSAIIDIYELGIQRQLFVQRFLESLVNAPRDLWHPVLIIVDEAHMFCPEAGKSPSASAVIDLMTRGRKRGFCGVLATQRIAKLHKDAAAEANNKLIGRSALDIDMKRAAAELGFTSREDMQKLRTLPAGTFYAFGPALSVEVAEFKVGPVETTHFRAGQRLAGPPTPPKERIRKVLAQLADLPHEAEEEARSADELRKRVRQLEQELRVAGRGFSRQQFEAWKAKATPTPATKIETKVIEKPLITDRNVKQLKQLLERCEAAMKSSTVLHAFATLQSHVEACKKALFVAEAWTKTPTPRMNGVRIETRGEPPPRPPPKRIAMPGGEQVALGRCERQILHALSTRHPVGLSRAQISTLSGYSPSSSSFANALGSLRSGGFVDYTTDGVVLTDSGLELAGGAQAPKSTEELLDLWSSRLPRRESAMLRALVASGDAGLSRAELAEATGMSLTSSSFANYLGHLHSNELAAKGHDNQERASKELR